MSVYQPRGEATYLVLECAHLCLLACAITAIEREVFAGLDAVLTKWQCMLTANCAC